MVRTFTSSIKKIILGSAILIGSQLQSIAQVDSSGGGGVSFSPGRIFFHTGLGKTETKYVTLSNSTKYSKSFSLDFNDFDMNEDGQKIYSPKGKSEFSISKWMTVSPTFLELKAGETKKVALILSVPDEPDAIVSRWSVLMITQMSEKKRLNPLDDINTMGMGVTNVMGFAVQLYQDQPKIADFKMELLGFKKFYAPDDTLKRNVQFLLELNNPTSYTAKTKINVELVNQATGKQIQMPVKEFAILPKHKRKTILKLPADLENGNYSVSAVVDFGNKDEILTAEMDFQK